MSLDGTTESTAPIVVHGVKVPMGPHLSEPVRAALLNGTYEAREIEAVRAMLRSNDIVLELGAGLGIVSAVCAEIVGSQNVFAVEANPTLREPICGLYAENGVWPRLDICALAAGPGNGACQVE